MSVDLYEKIRARRARVGVVGLGYVGLPLAVAFAKAGFTVKGIDIDRGKVASLKKGVSYVLDVPSAVLKPFLKNGRFEPKSELSALAALDAVIICVPTPLSKTGAPDVSFIVDATRRIAGHLKRGQLVVLESTTYPGTTEEVVRPILEKSGLKAERDFFLAFSPERVDPGNERFDTTSIPKVVGGIGPRSASAARALYGTVIKTVVPVSSAKTAEMVKLLENTFRSVNIGLINEIACMCGPLGIDIWEVIEAAKTKPFGFMAFYPGPGIGGHCLPVDPLYLSWKSRRHGFEAKMIELASSINESMPHYVVDRIHALLNSRKKALRGASLLVLGVAYKKNVDDVRESPASDVIEHLLKEGAKVHYSDPFVPKLAVNAHTLKSHKLTPELLHAADCVILLTDHTAFDGAVIARHSKMILDTRNFLRKHAAAAKDRLFFL